MPRPTLGDPPRFWRRRSVQRMLSGVVAVLGVVVLGVAGYVAMGWKPFDALFMVVITISGVGFGEVQPLTTTWARVHTMLVIGFGLVAIAYTVAGFLQFLTEGEIRQLLGQQRVRRQIETLRGHTILVGFGRMGELVASELDAKEVQFVVIERAGDRIADIEQAGYLHVAGDATEESTLATAGVGRAKTLVTAVASDADSVFITLTTRQMCPEIQIIARAEQPSTQKKLRQAGANHVVLPASIGAHRIASLLTNPSAVEFVELVTQRGHLAIEMNEFPILADGTLRGLTLREADIGRKTGVVVVAIKRADGNVDFPPTADVSLVVGDSLVLLGRRSNLDHFRLEFKV